MHVTVNPDTSGQKRADSRFALVNVDEVAKILDCSTAHVRRLSDAGKMPAPVRVGALVRWSRAAIETWVSDGCKPCRKGGAA